MSLIINPTQVQFTQMIKLIPLYSLIAVSAATLFFPSFSLYASGMQPETSVVIVEQDDGEGSINVKNTDAFPLLMITNIENIPEDTADLLIATPPAARVEPGKTQRVRFMITATEPLKTERLMRVTFEGIPPTQKGKSEVRMSIRQNLPVIIRPAGLAREDAPWKGLVWKQNGNSMTVSNPSPYIVRLGQEIKTLPENTSWMLPNSYVLPGQTLTISPRDNKQAAIAKAVRLSPATTWGFTVDNYDAAVTH